LENTFPSFSRIKRINPISNNKIYHSKEQVSSIKIERNLLLWVAVFLFFLSAFLTLSPAFRFYQESIDLHNLRWEHWRGFVIWCCCFALIHYFFSQQQTIRDPLLLPIVAFLIGMGLITIYRLSPQLGDKQTLWLVLATVLFISGSAIKNPIPLLERIAAPLIAATLGLNALPLFIGVHPLGYGPNLWLSFHGFYIQPSELLKFSLLLYLARGFSSHAALQSNPAWNNSPKGDQWFYKPFCLVIVCCLSLGLLFLQRDFGTLVICGTLIVMLFYLALGIKKVSWLIICSIAFLLWANLSTLNIVHIRIEAWLNPWLDPSGKSYQILQSLIAIANGGIFGKGIGLGHPLFIPISFSDFIFSAIVEENGIIGGISIILIYALFTYRGIKITQKNQHAFLNIASAGATYLISLQSLMIMAGNVRLLPLTGVTLPFLSYGGSSLVISMMFFMLIYTPEIEGQYSAAPSFYSKRQLNLFWLAAIGYSAIALSLLWWGIVRAPILLARPDNARKTLNQFFIKRGSIYTRDFQPINSSKLTGSGYMRIFQRQYHVIPLAPIVGYHHYRYGSSGIEHTLNDLLSGEQQISLDQRNWALWFGGLPPSGNNIQLTLDSQLQQKADQLLENHAGSLVLLDGKNGEILAISSHPYFNPNLLTRADGTANVDYWTALTWIDEAPFINRAVQGTYYIAEEQVPLEIRDGFYQSRNNLTTPKRSTQALRLAILAAAVSNHGKPLPPKIVLSIQDFHSAWKDPKNAFPLVWENNKPILPLLASETAENFMSRFPSPNSRWAIWGISRNNKPPITWLMGAALHNQRCRYALATILEEENLPLAQQINNELLSGVLSRYKP